MVSGQRRRPGVISHGDASGTVPMLVILRWCGRSCPVSGASAGQVPVRNAVPLADAIPLGVHVPGLAQRCSRGLPSADVNGPNASGIVAAGAVTGRQRRQ
jgi:hypothetical protein